jgi:translation initiation factor IF-3
MTRINERIRVPEIRVLYGEHNAIMPTSTALQKAKSLGLDLVEVAPHARPPVCKITDYGKWKYQQSKQKKDKKTTAPKEKEVKFRVNIEKHDYEIKMTRAEDFLCLGFKVRFNLQFRGRQNAHKDLGFQLMERVKVDLDGSAQCDLEPRLGGRNILMMLSPRAAAAQKRKFRTDDHEDLIDLEAHEAAEAAENFDEGFHEDEHDDDANEASPEEATEATAETEPKAEATEAKAESSSDAKDDAKAETSSDAKGDAKPKASAKAKSKKTSDKA